jgi:hypothetical protein
VNNRQDDKDGEQGAGEALLEALDRYEPPVLSGPINDLLRRDPAVELGAKRPDEERADEESDCYQACQPANQASLAIRIFGVHNSLPHEICRLRRDRPAQSQGKAMSVTLSPALRTIFSRPRVLVLEDDDERARTL